MALTMIQRFLRGLVLSPERPAVRVGSDEVTYQQLHDTALLWAGALMAGGSPRSVGVFAGRSIESYAGHLAAQYAGATVVPLQPSLPAALTRRMLKMVGVETLIADRDGVAVLPDVVQDSEVRVLDTGIPVSDFPTVPTSSSLRITAPVRVAPSDRAYVLFTSGSTGVPKGVPISHGGFAHYFEQLDKRADFVPDDVFAQTYDLNFGPGVHDMFAAWGAGGTIQVVPPSAYLDLPGFLADHGVTVWHSTPSAIPLAREMGALESGALHGLRWSFFGGEALRCRDAEDWLEAAPSSRLENLYGATEMSAGICWHRWSGAASKECSVNGAVPIGRVHEGHEFRLVTEQGSESAVEGELWITGPQMTPGYLDQADDQGRFVELEGRRWYRMGDRVRVGPDGELAYIGRMDSQVKVHGWRVELAEVDHVVRGFDGVRDAVTVTRSGPYGTELVVFYTGLEQVESVLADGVREVLPTTAVPRRYIHLERLPLNSNRKVDRLALRTRAELLPMGKER